MANSKKETVSNNRSSLTKPDGLSVPRVNSDISYGPGLIEMVAGDEPEEEKLAARSSSIIEFYPNWCRCCKLLNCNRKKPLGHEPTTIDQIKDFFACPPVGTFARLILIAALCVCLWFLLFHLFRPMEIMDDRTRDINRNPAWVKGPIFALGIIEITGLISGVLLKRFLNLPPLLGPLILGIIYNNVDSINVFAFMGGTHRDTYNSTSTAPSEDQANHWVKPIRVIALALILTRAGLELSPKQLRKLKGVVPLLAFSPCVVEACACALFSYIFFNTLEPDPDRKIGIAMCFVGGFALGAVSPAVVVPGALSLKKGGYGVIKGIPTLLIAASSIDDVLAISIYTIALGFAIQDNDEPNWQRYTGGIIGITAGVIHGVVIGIILHFLPPRHSKNKAEQRLILLLLVNFVSLFGYEDKFYNGAGSVSVLVTSFIASFGWRSQAHWKRPMKKIEKILAHLWVLWVPLIFGTIGKEIDLTTENFQGITLAKTFGVIGICVVIRCATAYGAVSCCGYNVKERLFIALSWIPKATVQAALAPLVLTRASDSTDENAKLNAALVVNVAILAVLITAPLGSVLIALTGPKLLQQNLGVDVMMQLEEEFPNGGGVDPDESVFELIEQNRSRTGSGVMGAGFPAIVSDSSRAGSADDLLVVTSSKTVLETPEETPK